MALFCGSEMKIRLNVCGSISAISAERLKLYVLSYKLALFCGSLMKIWLNVFGGISAERHKVYILSDKLELFSDLK